MDVNVVKLKVVMMLAVPSLTKSIKIKVSLSILWVVLAMLFAGGMANSYSGFQTSTFLGVSVFLNFPLLLYWLGFWIWGDGYLIRFVLWPFSMLKKSISPDYTEADLIASIPKNKTSYFIRHWKGELTLVKSYWINGGPPPEKWSDLNYVDRKSVV